MLGAEGGERMTEAEWLSSANPSEMGVPVVEQGRATERVLRLYMAAFWHWQSYRLKKQPDQDRLRGRSAVVGEWAESGVEPNVATGDQSFVGFNTSAKDGFRATVRAPGQWGKNGGPAQEFAVRLLHEVFGNPFRPVRIRPEWLTKDVILRAHLMYDSRDFSAMPILADALQDTGCDNADILDHCRGGGPHVRGCWVVDLVLGRE
jgi:hypothetical protein